MVAVGLFPAARPVAVSLIGAAAALVLALAVSPSPLAAQPGPNLGERLVKPEVLPLDRPDTWTLHFRYKPPRIVVLDGLDATGRPAKKVVWYLWYQVYNLSGEPQTFLPRFDLVTKDLLTTHLDQPEPYLLEQINRIENPTGHPSLELRSTISISKRPVPPTLPDAIPRVVTGAAIWTDMAEKAPKTNIFSIYVTGLSNGVAADDTPSGEKLIKRKTLQLNFLRPTDDERPRATDIVPDDRNGPAERWVYRTVTVVEPKAP